MAKKLRPMSVSMEPDMHNMIREYADRTGTDVSKFIRGWLEQFPFHDDEVVPVVVDVPKRLIGDRPALERYCQSLTNGIVNAVSR